MLCSNYNPKVSNPYMSNNISQMRSDGYQTPFYFGGSQVPEGLAQIHHSITYEPVIKKRYKKPRK